ncbi:MAG: hypothetical protein HY331_13160 [Chloroflexi bacterium]|nr:hypothetical protein [Chloroflexota bacterium]
MRRVPALLRFLWLAALGAFVTMGAPPALANGNDLHIGGIHIGIPPVVAWISGGGLALVFVMLFTGWAVSYSSQQRKRREDGKDGKEEVAADTHAVRSSKDGEEEPHGDQ